MAAFYNGDHRPRLFRKMYGLKRCEIGISKLELNELKSSGKLGDREVDDDFAWLLISLAEEKYKNDNGYEVNDNDNEIEDEDGNEYVDEDEDEDEDGDGDGDEDEKDVDPQYRLFLENLTENGRSYKLNISQNAEEPDYLEYEKEEQSDGFDDLQAYMYGNGNKATSTNDQRVKRRLAKTTGDTSIQEEASRKKKKINEQKSIKEPNKDIVERDYQLYLNAITCSDSGCPQIKFNQQLANIEDECVRSDSDTDSDVLIVENVQDCNQVDKIQKRSSLKEQLIICLKRPYSKKELERHSKWIEKKMPICRHLDLRDRPVSIAVDGAVKSVLDDGPGSFQLKLKAAIAQKDDHKHLNLLRMFRFWLTKLPNENIFQPWLDEDIMNVQPVRTVTRVQKLPNKNMLQPSSDEDVKNVLPVGTVLPVHELQGSGF